MDVSKLYKKLLPLILLFPMTSYGNNVNEITSENDETSLLLNPSETIVLNFSSSSIAINHQNLQDIIGEKFRINTEEPLGIKFHEESNTLDFSTLDGISFIVSLVEISGAPGNGLGGTDPQTNN